jgi:hypothetical protein
MPGIRKINVPDVALGAAVEMDCVAFVPAPQNNP